MSSSDDPVATARAFVDAVTWGEHTTVWSLMSPDARAAVLDLATRRGMDPLLAARLREGHARDDERDDFLADLLHGLRTELTGVDLDELRAVLGGNGTTLPGSVLVHLLLDVPAELGAPLPVGRIELTRVGDCWLVVRLDGVR